MITVIFFWYLFFFKESELCFKRRGARKWKWFVLLMFFHVFPMFDFHTVCFLLFCVQLRNVSGWVFHSKKDLSPQNSKRHQKQTATKFIIHGMARLIKSPTKSREKPRKTQRVVRWGLGSFFFFQVNMWAAGVCYDVAGKGFDPTVGKITKCEGGRVSARWTWRDLSDCAPTKTWC